VGARSGADAEAAGVPGAVAEPAGVAACRRAHRVRPAPCLHPLSKIKVSGNAQVALVPVSNFLDRVALLAALPPILAVEVLAAYVDALRRNSRSPATTLDAVPAREPVELLPVCSCCRQRALRPAGWGRVCPDCDRGDLTRPEVPNRPPPPEGTTGGV
jgi:hypothetical protein